MRIFFLLVLSITLLAFQGCSLAQKVEATTLRNLKNAPYDVIVVPGYPYRDVKYPELFTTRLFYAKELYDKGLARNIIFSGAAVHTPYVEGTIMKIFADSLGISSTHTFAETVAEHSHQNARLGYKMARQLGFKKVAIATDPFQFSYMTLLRGLFAPRTKLLSFHPNKMGYYNQQLPAIDSSTAFKKDFQPIGN